MVFLHFTVTTLSICIVMPVRHCNFNEPNATSVHHYNVIEPNAMSVSNLTSAHQIQRQYIIVTSTSQIQRQYVITARRLLQWQHFNAMSIRYWDVKIAIKRQHVLQCDQIKVNVLMQY